MIEIKNTAISFSYGRFFLTYGILRFVLTTFSTASQSLFVFLQSEAVAINKTGNARSCKHQIREEV